MTQRHRPDRDDCCAYYVVLCLVFAVVRHKSLQGRQVFALGFRPCACAGASN